MKISSRKVGEAVVVMIEGNLDTNTSPNAQTYLNNLVALGSKKILLNFENTNYVSSAGLRVVLQMGQMMKKNEGDLRLCNFNPTVREVFEITGFTSIFNIFDSENESMEGF
jgi:anti-sigma B factor antagonist